MALEMALDADVLWIVFEETLRHASLGIATQCRVTMPVCEAFAARAGFVRMDS